MIMPVDEGYVALDAKHEMIDLPVITKLQTCKEIVILEVEFSVVVVNEIIFAILDVTCVIFAVEIDPALSGMSPDIGTSPIENFRYSLC